MLNKEDLSVLERNSVGFLTEFMIRRFYNCWDECKKKNCVKCSFRNRLRKQIIKEKKRKAVERRKSML